MSKPKKNVEETPDPAPQPERRGGKREGAGRPKSGEEKKTYLFSFDAKTSAILDRLPKRQKSAIISRLLIEKYGAG